MSDRDFGDDTDTHMPLAGLTDADIAALEEERLVMRESEQQMASRQFRQSLVSAVHSITEIAKFSPNEKLRLDASKYVIERCMGRVQDTPPAPVDDPITALLADVVREYTDELGN